MSADNANAVFRDILAQFEPKPAIPMVGADEKSTRILNDAAEVLCGADRTRRRLLQNIYDLGRTDGGLEACDRVETALKVSP